MNDIMVDLETLGTVPGCVILSIGAVAFDELEVDEQHGFYQVIFQPSCELAGLHVDDATKAWWEDQSEEARAVLKAANQVESSTMLRDALTLFNNFILDSYPTNVRIWGNGANFDNPLLACAYKAAGIKPAYEFWNERCYRTVKNQYRDVKLVREGTYHNALDDARSQAKHLVEICQKRGWRLA